MKMGQKLPDKWLWTERAVLSGTAEATSACGIRSSVLMEGDGAVGGRGPKTSKFPPED